MDVPDTLLLRNGSLALTLAPAIGGAVAGFRREGFALMRETPEQAIRDGLVRQTSCYPLIPYSNRIAHGHFHFEDHDYQLALNFGDHPHSIHGNAWQRPWHVADASDRSCGLTFEHRPVGDEAEGWPFAYAAQQSFALDPDGFSITLTIRNKDDRRMPAGFGLHPFFPRRPGTRLQFSAEGFYRTGPDSLPAEHEPVPPEWDYAKLRPLDDPHLDNCFTGWDRHATIRFEDDGVALRMSADPVFGHCVVYVPTGRDFFAVEPVSHMNDAVNRLGVPGNGLKILAPGETLTGTVRFHVEAFR